jgi:CRISPR-associated protein Csm3
MSKLLGKAIVTGDIRILTGIRIGGSSGGLKIGGVDLNVITDPFGTPYIPGSSLKGKTRSIMEHHHERPFNERGIHLCQTDEAYNKCPVCRVWGTMVGAAKMSSPTITRLLVSDVFLDKDSITSEMRDSLELRWTEVKFETAINRITGTASGTGSLRQIERVPAGAVFKDMRIVFNVFAEEDKELLKEVFVALELLEHDYLGGMGSRGYGRVSFEGMKVYWNSNQAYQKGDIALDPKRALNSDAETPQTLVRSFDQLRKGLK